MNDRCFSDDELAELIELAADHPRQEHVRRCPRCQARLLDHRSFLRQPSEAEAPGLAFIERRMAAALHAEAERAAGVGPDSRSPGAPARTTRARAGRLPAWAAAAAAIVVIAAGVFALRPRGYQEDVLRATPGAENGTVRALAARAEGGRATLSWEPFTGADSYVVVLMSPELTERGRLGPFATTGVTVALDTLATPGAPAGPLVWQVLAMRGGDPIGRSPIQSVSAGP